MNHGSSITPPGRHPTSGLVHGATRPSSQRSRLLLVREPVKSVRGRDHADRTPLRLAIGVIAALGVVGLVWILGGIGYRLGFAPLVGVPELAGRAGGGLAAGTLMVISFPRAIFHAGLAQPTGLMLAFLLIALPAAALGAAQPQTPGGPRPKSGIAVIAVSGAVASMICGSLLIWWAGSPLRSDMLRVLPLDPAAAAAWHRDMLTVAGLDVLGVVSAALWLVLVWRLPVPLWLRAIAISAAFFTLTVLSVAMSMSNVAATQVGADRAMAEIGNARRVILGSTAHHVATLGVDTERQTFVELRGVPETIVVRGTGSIVGYLTDRAEESERLGLE